MNNKENLIYLVSNKEWGGGEQYVYDLCNYFKKEGYPITLISRPTKDVISRLQKLELPLYPLPLKGFTDIVSAYRLSKHIQPNQKYVIHVHNFKDAFTAAFARLFSGNHQVRIVLTRHLVRYGKNAIHYQWLYKQLDQIIFVSNLALEAFLKATPSIEKSRLSIIRNSIIIPSVQKVSNLRKELKISEDAILMMYHGRITHEKGLHILLDAMDTFKQTNTYLVLIGSGQKDYVSQLKKQITNYGLEKQVFLIGPRYPVLPYLKECDFGIIPSIAAEACPLSCMEYMSQERTIITTNNGGQSEYLTSGKNSLLIPPNDSNTLKECIQTLINDKHLRKRLGKQASIDYFENMSYDLFIQRIKEAYGI